jgi:hypothetical protein
MAHRQMLFAKGRQRCDLSTVRALHGHQEFLLARARRVKRQKTRILSTLYASALADIANRAFLQQKGRLVKRRNVDRCERTSFQRCLDILSTPVIGSMNTSLATRVSGTQIAQSRCTQSPKTVCLKAPPSFGQRIHDYWAI